MTKKWFNKCNEYNCFSTIELLIKQRVRLIFAICKQDNVIRVCVLAYYMARVKLKVKITDFR